MGFKVAVEREDSVEDCIWNILWDKPGSGLYHCCCILLSRPQSYDLRLNTEDAGKCSLFVCPGRRNSVANIQHFLHTLSELCFNNYVENYINKMEGLMSAAEYPHLHSHPS